MDGRTWNRWIMPVTAERHQKAPRLLRSGSIMDELLTLALTEPVLICDLFPLEGNVKRVANTTCSWPMGPNHLYCNALYTQLTQHSPSCYHPIKKHFPPSREHPHPHAVWFKDSPFSSPSSLPRVPDRRRASAIALHCTIPTRSVKHRESARYANG